MNTHADKTSDNKSLAVANSLPKQQSSSESAIQFVNNRPEAIAQRKLQEAINNSPRVQQFKAYQQIANSSAQVKQLRAYQAMADNFTSQTAQQKENVEEETGQGKFEPIQKKENNTGLPDNLKSGIENISGYSMDDVKVHRNSGKPAQLQAHAYAQGTDIHLAPGQEKHLPHEAWHVVQQKQGRVKPTIQKKRDLTINDDAGLEKEADVMGSKAQGFNNSNLDTNKKLSLKTNSSALNSNSNSIHQRVRFSNSNSFYRAPIDPNLLPLELKKDFMDHYKADQDAIFMTKLSPKTRAWVAENSRIPGAPAQVGELVWVEVGAADWQSITTGAEAGSLEGISAPKVEQLSQEHFALQSDIMNELDHLVSAIDAPNRKQVYRLGTVEINFADGNPTFTMGAPVLVVPSGVANGYFLVSENNDIKQNIATNVRNTLTTSDQLKYIQQNELVNQEWKIIVDVDFYYERPSNSIGFHKDTVGRSLFVNLNFNNLDHELVGPEYILNPPAIQEHDQHIGNKLPDEFKKDLARERKRIPTPTEIQGTRIPKRGMVSFVDEMIHHSTPFIGHRGISKNKLIDIARKAKTSYRLKTLIRGTSKAKGNDRVFLSDYIGMDAGLIHTLFTRVINDSVPTGYISTKLKDNPDFVALMNLNCNKHDYELLENLSATDHPLYSTDELYQAGVRVQFLQSIIKVFNIHELDTVSLAGCEDHCDLDANIATHKIMPPHAPRLTRSMSFDLDHGLLPPPAPVKRQFLRTWVQAIRRV
ncbi:DUF4157 domain-containing protein [Flavobacterium sp. N3904]|uniref:eCIS core domain-containing protein n=1 Tax=Flavobacterium sp. N3904 TaxID=2986835 RepID=UPI00222513CD|nr:DUF4157 domain-containing protein [Flavobacterium sp. N3904]